MEKQFVQAVSFTEVLEGTDSVKYDLGVKLN
jgi:hypothetical protein